MEQIYYQVIVVIETDKKAKTDCRYIDEILNEYFSDYLSSPNVTYQKVYMKGKFSWNTMKVTQEIDKHIRSVPDYRSFVLYVIDTDDIIANREDATLVENVKTYCDKCDDRYFAFFNRNIEHVLIGNSVSDRDKVRTVQRFIAKGLIRRVSRDKLVSANYLSSGRSNILTVLLSIHDQIAINKK